MSVLAGRELLRRIVTEADPEKRLVVGPMLEPVEQISTTQASVDIRLGCDFRLAIASTIGVLDEFADPATNHFSDLSNVYSRFYVPLGGAVTVHPHQLLLAMSLEYLRLPYDLMAYVVGRSTLGRLGLIIATAVGIHPRFYGPLTLEIRNLGEAPIRLYPGQVIAQLFFHTVDVGPVGVEGDVATDETRERRERASAAVPDGRRETAVEDAAGKRPQYSGAIDTLPGRISNHVTSKRLRRLRREQLKASETLRGGPAPED